jgi:Hemopexin
MASSARIDGSLPDPGDNSTKGLIFSRGWGVEYEFAGDPPARTNQPKRLRAIGFPAPFDSDLEGALRGRGGFSAFLYLFKNGRYLRLVASTLTPDGPEAATAPAWGLPADWSSLDAVLPGRGTKINFCYFFRGSQYVRFDWAANAVSPGYPKSIAAEWHMASPFDANIDGVIVGQSGLTTRGFLFKTLPQTVNSSGALTAPGSPGSKAVRTPGFGRYDFTAGSNLGAVADPLEVLSRWGGLIPLLDAGPAIDTAIDWCRKALRALSTPATPVLVNALAHHFRTASPSAAQLAEINNRMGAVRDRLDRLPDRFQWTRGLVGPAQTRRDVLTEIGDAFSRTPGPNGRAAILIHEAVHFVFTGSPLVDVPEWSGETVNGQPVGVAPPIPGVAISGIPYGSLTPAQAIANPSSYAAFAQEIAFNGSDTRFGAARPHE